jgi:endonuclease-3
MMMNNILNNLDIMVSDPVCELNYNKDYELLIAIVLSAQCTDKRVNEVTRVLFDKYDIYSLAKASISDIKSIIKPCGMSDKKSQFVKDIAVSLVNNYDGKVPNNREYLESLSGVGHKTCNVFLAEYYHENTIAVDTHVKRVATRLNLVKNSDSVLQVEKKLERKVPKDKWSRFHLQMVLFGRYTCKAIKPNCDNCLNKNICKYYKDNL